MVHLNSRSALQRTVTSLVISAWPSQLSCETVASKLKSTNHKTDTNSETPKSHPGLCKRLIDCLNESVYFDEIAVGFTKLQSECRDFVATLKHYKVPLGEDIENVAGSTFYSFDQIEILGGIPMSESIQKTVKKPKVTETLLERRKTVKALWTSTTSEFAALNVM